MKREDYVSIELAKQMKEKGFCWPCYSCYTIEGFIMFRFLADDFNKTDAYSRPCLYDAQKWLRKENNIHIVIDNSASGYGWFLYKADNGTRIIDYADDGPNDGGCWDTYEEALNDGIFEALKLI